MKLKTYYDIENECQFIFEQNAPFYHLCTPGDLVTDIFVNREIREFGLNLLGICAFNTLGFKIVAYSEMSNHLHVLYAGTKVSGERFFDQFLPRLSRIAGSSINLSGFKPKFIPLLELKAVRNEIVYINRNGYVVNPECTPFSYPWGSGTLYFNPLFDRIPSRPYSSLNQADKRRICRSRDINLSGNPSVIGNLIAPYEYCHVSDIGERLFRNAHQYFNLLSRDYEAYSEVAKSLGDSMFIPDEEMFSVARQVCTRYNVNNPTLLKPQERIEVARIMHSEYNASNKQLQRILKLDKGIVSQLFPNKE